MPDIFDPKNWADLMNDSGFWNAAIILVIAAVALVAALYADNIREWRAHREEKAKWLFWNR
jgi:anti-sigma-K factor RskA